MARADFVQNVLYTSYLLSGSIHLNIRTLMSWKRHGIDYVQSQQIAVI